MKKRFLNIAKFKFEMCHRFALWLYVKKLFSLPDQSMVSQKSAQQPPLLLSKCKFSAERNEETVHLPLCDVWHHPQDLPERWWRPVQPEEVTFIDNSLRTIKKSFLGNFGLKWNTLNHSPQMKETWKTSASSQDWSTSQSYSTNLLLRFQK